MSDGDDKPNVPRPRPGLVRSRPPSFPEIVGEITQSHRVESDPPATRWLQRRVGRVVIESARWVVKRKLWWLVIGLAHASGHLVRWAMGH